MVHSQELRNGGCAAGHTGWCGSLTLIAMSKITRYLANPDNPRSLSSRARARRWHKLTACFPDLAAMKVLDLGGTPRFWRSAADRPAHITLVNIADEACDEPWMELRVGDACTPPVSGHYDLVISNSLIEHVGGHWRRQQLADAIRELAPRHWVQTPNRYFPIEPHWVCPGFQFLPFDARVWVTQRWPLGHVHWNSEAAAVKAVHEIELVTPREMRHYFPESSLWMERWAGIPKSLVAVKTH